MVPMLKAGAAATLAASDKRKAPLIVGDAGIEAKTMPVCLRHTPSEA